MDEFAAGFQYSDEAESEPPLKPKDSPVQATMQMKIDSMERELSQAIQRICLLEESSKKIASDPRAREFEKHLHTFARITTGIFGDATFSVEVDPESGDHCFLATVSVSGSDAQADAACNQWHLRMIEELPEQIGRFALGVQFK